MLEAPDQAVALLKERLRPAQPQDADKVAKLMVLLDSAKFAERDQARAALEKMGESTVGTIKATLAGKIPLEMRRRLESLLSKGEATSPISLRQHRAVALLEWIGTPTARAYCARGQRRSRRATDRRGPDRLEAAVRLKRNGCLPLPGSSAAGAGRNTAARQNIDAAEVTTYSCRAILEFSGSLRQRQYR